MTGLFTDDQAPIPLAAQIECVEREIKLRERVYPRWIVGARITQDKADREIATMRAVLATLKGIKP